MSLHEYQAALVLRKNNAPFYGLVMAAMMSADDVNLAKLRAAWPGVFGELEARRKAPGGVLTGEQRRGRPRA